VVQEDLLDHSPAVHVRRPWIDYESHATGLDRKEVGALLVAAGLGIPAEHALISLLALNGLRVSEATSADIEALGTERGHRTLAITRKGTKKAVIPLAPRTDLHHPGRAAAGPARSRADRPPGRPPRRGGQEDRARIPCGTRSSPPPSTPACRCATSRKPPPTPTRASR